MRCKRLFMVGYHSQRCARPATDEATGYCTQHDPAKRAARRAAAEAAYHVAARPFGRAADAVRAYAKRAGLNHPEYAAHVIPATRKGEFWLVVRPDVAYLMATGDEHPGEIER
jgi:hypothetical protein